MKKALETIELIKSSIMLGGLFVLIGCGILMISGLMSVALKSAGEFLALYMLVSAITLTAEGIIKSLMKKKEDEED